MKKVIGILIAMILVFAIGGAGYFYIAPLFANDDTSADASKIYVQSVDDIVNGYGVSFTANRYSGVVETQELVKVDADVDKKVKATYVKEGDAVKTGDKLFEYDIDNMKVQLEEDFSLKKISLLSLRRRTTLKTTKLRLRLLKRRRKLSPQINSLQSPTRLRALSLKLKKRSTIKSRWRRVLKSLKFPLITQSLSQQQTVR